MYQLIRLTRHGLEPEKGTDAVIEKLVMDRCLKVGQGNPKTADQLV